jgi:hypothetical protein
MMEAELDDNLSDGDSDHEVTAGEADIIDANQDETERELIKRIESRKY